MGIQGRTVQKMPPNECTNQSNKEWTVVNGTFTGHFNKRMPNMTLLAATCHFNYNPKRFNACVIRQKLGTILLFESGSFVIIGVKCMKVAHRLAIGLEKILQTKVLSCKLCHIYVRNFVVWFRPSHKLITLLNSAFGGQEETKSVVKDAVIKAGLNYSHEPEMFPSTKFYLKDSKATVCVFRQKGTAIITGICNLDVVNGIIDKINCIVVK